MASILQTITATSGDNYVNSISTTFSSNVSAGSALIVFDGYGATDATAITGVTDNRGNTWSKVQGQKSDTRGSTLWVSPNASPGSTTVTVSSGSTYQRQSIIIHEISGVVASSVVHSSSTFTNGSGYNNTHTMSVTTTGSTFIVAGYGGSATEATYSGSSGFSNLTQIANGDGASVTQSRDSSTSGTYTATFNSSNYENGSGAIVALNTSAPTPPPNVTKLLAQPSDTSVVLVWTKSPGATAYKISYGSTNITLGDVGYYVVTGLTNGESVTFTVKASSVIGDSSGSTSVATPFLPSLGKTPSNWHPYGVMPNKTVSQLRTIHRTFYDNWSNFTLSSQGIASGAPSGCLRVTVPDQNIYPQPSGMINGTVSEGVGYMLVQTALFSNPQLPAGIYDPSAYAKFNCLWRYINYYKDANGLMNWNIGNEGTVYGVGSAADSDYDIAWALVLMHRIHGSSGQFNYNSLATSYINAIGTYCFSPSNYPTYPNIALNGDMWGVDTDNYMSDYFRPGILREFYYHTGDSAWIDRISANYAQALQYFYTNYTGGVVPDRQTRSNTAIAGWSPFKATYNSVRLGYGISTDYLWNGGSVANSLGYNTLDRMANKFKSLYSTGGGIYSPDYNMDGSSTQSYTNGSALGMVAPAALMSSGNQTFSTQLVDALSSSPDQSNSYFNGGVAIMGLSMVSGMNQTYRSSSNRSSSQFFFFA